MLRLCGQDDAPCLPQRGGTSEHALILLEGQGGIPGQAPKVALQSQGKPPGRAYEPGEERHQEDPRHGLRGRAQRRSRGAPASGRPSCCAPSVLKTKNSKLKTYAVDVSVRQTRQSSDPARFPTDPSPLSTSGTPRVELRPGPTPQAGVPHCGPAPETRLARRRRRPEARRHYACVGSSTR